ncbi:hypothetical protein [Archangium sp.]|uniref:hypothetical protein n=1 Tax=Archangium sp. TaxID=1872627 RepID=UPI00286D12CA|nr:hypothetical protein [Archangium sp.]
MNEEDISQRLREGGLTLSFDTNALFLNRKFLTLCDEVALWNQRLGSEGRQPVGLRVCTVAHSEKLFDLKQAFQDAFDIGSIMAAFHSKGLVLESFTDKHALALAIRLGEFYPDDKTWREAKRKRCIQCVGLNPNQVQAASGTGRRCGATVDWLIGAHAHAEGYVLVTKDKGVEMKHLKRVELDTLAEALRKLMSGAA